MRLHRHRSVARRPGLDSTPSQEVTVDRRHRHSQAHSHRGAAGRARRRDRHVELRQQPRGLPAAVGWLAEHDAARRGDRRREPGQLRTLPGRRAGRRRPRGAARSGLAHASRAPPPGPGKTDPGDALAIAQVVLAQARRTRARRWNPSWSARSGCSSCSAAASSAIAPRRSSGCAPTGPSSTPSPRPRSSTRPPEGAAPAQADRVRRRPGRAHRRALHPRARPRHRGPQPPHRRARDRDRRRCSTSTATRSPICSAPAATSPRRVIAHAGDVRRFREASRLRALLRRRPDPLRLRPNRRAPPPAPRRQPPTERRALPHRDRPTTPPPRRQGLPRPQDPRRQDPPRSPPRAQTPPRQRPLPPTARLGQHHTRDEPT